MIEDFFNNLLLLKKIQRKGWKNNLGLENPESVADHSYSVTGMSMILGDLMALDTNKMMKMALLHDLAESKVGDFTPGEISKNEKLKIEDGAMKKILSKLPQNLYEQYISIWEEYQKNESKEALCIHDIDKLEMAFQAKSYLLDGNPKNHLQSFFETAKHNIKNEKLKEILTKLLD